MAHTACKNWPRTAASLLNVFLTPSPMPRSIAHLRGPSPSFFSTSGCLQYPRKSKKRKKDNNMMRGMSALKGTGLHKRMKLSVSVKDIPEPVPRSEITPQKGDEDHGLWGFFNKDRTLLSLPEDLGNHGRAWTKHELRRKSWEDLHSLWWVCTKQRNRLKTEDVERKRLKAGYGDAESQNRMKVINETMSTIRKVLKERWFSWEDARTLAMNDPEIQVTEDRRVQYIPTLDQYDPSYMFEEEDAENLSKSESKDLSPFAEELMPSKEEMENDPPKPSGKPSTDGLEPIVPQDQRVTDIQRY